MVLTEHCIGLQNFLKPSSVFLNEKTFYILTLLRTISYSRVIVINDYVKSYIVKVTFEVPTTVIRSISCNILTAKSLWPKPILDKGCALTWKA